MSFSCVLPPLLHALHQLPFAYAQGQGIDFLPLPALQTAAKTKAWFRAWTGNATLTGAEYRVFGHDRMGGTAACWLVHQDAGLLQQPIGFFGSHGELGVVAADFADYLWLLAAGYGPSEAICTGLDREATESRFTAFAATHAPAAKKSASAVIARAKHEFLRFEPSVRAQCY